MAERRSSREMFPLVEYYQESGLTRKEFAQESGMALSTLDYWRRKYARRSGGSSFVEIRPMPSEVPTAEIEYPNGVRVRFFAPVDSGYLLKLIAPERRAA